MERKELAAILNDREYPLDTSEYFDRIAKEAKQSRLLIVYGASDDLVEFDGLFTDEVSVHGVGTVYIDNEGIIQTLDEYSENIDFNDQEGSVKLIRGYLKRWDKAHQIKVLWCAKESAASWSYETDIPHDTFRIFEEGDLYCIGMVIAERDLNHAPS